MGYVITGVIGSMIGATFGVAVMAFCITAKRSDEQDNNRCNGCFGAANNDCSRCPYNGIIERN